MHAFFRRRRSTYVTCAALQGRITILSYAVQPKKRFVVADAVRAHSASVVSTTEHSGPWTLGCCSPGNWGECEPAPGSGCISAVGPGRRPVCDCCRIRVPGPPRLQG